MFKSTLAGSLKAIKENALLFIILGILSIVFNISSDFISGMIEHWAFGSTLRSLTGSGILVLVSLTLATAISTTIIIGTSNTLLDRKDSIISIVKKKSLPLTINLVVILICGSMFMYAIIATFGMIFINLSKELLIAAIVLFILVCGYFLINYVFYFQSFILNDKAWQDGFEDSRRVVKGNKLLVLIMWILPQMLIIIDYFIPDSLSLISSIAISGTYAVLSTVMTTALFISLNGHILPIEEDETEEELVTTEV